MDVKQIAGQHGKSVALVFKRLGISAPVTPKEIVYATLVYQGDFINPLVEQIAKDNRESTGFDDSEPAPHTEIVNPTGAQFPEQGKGFGQTQTMQGVSVASKSKAAKKSLWDILGTVAEAAGKFVAAKNSQGQTVYVQQPSAPDTGKKPGNKMLIYGGIALAVVLVAILLIKRK